MATNQFLFTAVNNILSGGNSDIAIEGGGSRSSTGINNNLYRDLFAEFGDRNTFALVGRSYFNLSTWRSVCHCDGSSKLVTSAQTTAFSSTTLAGGAETVFASDAVNTSVTTMDAAADPTLQELATIGVGNGLNLSDIATGELAGLTFDKNGALRPTSGPWNVGPF